MQKVNTFDTAFDARNIADGRTDHATGLGLAIRDVWAWLLALSTRERTVEATHEPDQSQVADSGPAVFVNYYDGAHERVSAAEPVVSFRKLAL